VSNHDSWNKKVTTYRIAKQEFGLVVQTNNPSTWEMEAGGAQV
jgi:hypothetical protein